MSVKTLPRCWVTASRVVDGDDMGDASPEQLLGHVLSMIDRAFYCAVWKFSVSPVQTVRGAGHCATCLRPIHPFWSLLPLVCERWSGLRAVGRWAARVRTARCRRTCGCTATRTPRRPQPRASAP